MSKGLFDINELRLLSGISTEKIVLEESLEEAPIASSSRIEPVSPYHMEYVLRRADELLSALSLVKKKAEQKAIAPGYEKKFQEEWADFKRLLLQIGQNASTINKATTATPEGVTEDSDFINEIMSSLK